MGTILPLDHRENLGQRHRAHLHVPQRKLLAGDAAGEIVHQLLFAGAVAVHDAAFLPLEWFALEDLGDAPAPKISMPDCISFLK